MLTIALCWTNANQMYKEVSPGNTQNSHHHNVYKQEMLQRVWKKKKPTIYLFFFKSAFGLRCCALLFYSCSKRGLLTIVVRSLLFVVASLVVEHKL